MIAIDFSGTLIKPSVVEEANLLRYSLLGIPEPEPEVHQSLHATKGHYDIIRSHIEKEFGITDDMEFLYVQNRGEEMTLSGLDMKTQMMTDLFRNAMFQVAQKHKSSIFREGMIDALRTLRERGHKLAIISGIRTDIISGMLVISGCEVVFDHIMGQDPILTKDNKQLLHELSKQQPVEFVVGDKLDDLEAASGAQRIFLKGGHPVGGEEDLADFVIEEPSELLDVIN
ncbi:MAG: HAD family hydrolase [Nanobdellota archaeon]